MSSKQHIIQILKLSYLSRLFILILQFISNVAITDHKADAYRNRYEESLKSQLSELPKSYRAFHYLVAGLTRWDSQYFLEIAKDGYIDEKHLAFLPLFPMLISKLRSLMFGNSHSIIQSLDLTYGDGVSIQELCTYLQLTIIGVVLNNFILFPIACLSLYQLTRALKGSNPTYAMMVTKWFCINPASIFFSTNYSESLFAALTFTSFYIIEIRSRHVDSVKRKSHKNNESLNSQVKRLVSLTLLGLSTATRSNGITSILFIGYQLIIKYIPILVETRVSWSRFVLVACRFMKDLPSVFISSLIVASGYVSFQIYSTQIFCSRNDIDSTPTWCFDALPHPYQSVQAKYWNVGLFHYYQIKQLPNFLLATPIVLLVLKGVLPKLRFSRWTDYRDIPYYLQAIILVGLCSVTINIQVITRIVFSSCPAIYWIITDLSTKSNPMRRPLYIYALGYLLVGTTLHCNFYPWT